MSLLLEETSAGVLLTVTESGFDRIPPERRANAFAANEAGWAKQCELIGKYLAARDDGGPDAIELPPREKTSSHANETGISCAPSGRPQRCARPPSGCPPASLAAPSRQEGPTPCTSSSKAERD